MKCKKILTVLEFSGNTGKILDYTIDLANKENASVCLLHSEPPISGYAYMAPGAGYGGFVGFGTYAVTNQEVESIRLEHDQQVLEILKKRLEEKGIDAEIRLLLGDPAWEIRRTAEEMDTDLIIIGTHHQGFFSRLLSENPERNLINNPPCPLLVIPEAQDGDGTDKIIE